MSEKEEKWYPKTLSDKSGRKIIKITIHSLKSEDYINIFRMLDDLIVSERLSIQDILEKMFNECISAIEVMLCTTLRTESKEDIFEENKKLLISKLDELATMLARFDFLRANEFYKLELPEMIDFIKKCKKDVFFRKWN